MGCRREAGAIEAYRADGWRGASRDRVRPNAALELATHQARSPAPPHCAASCGAGRGGRLKRLQSRQADMPSVGPAVRAVAGGLPGIY